LVLLGGPGVGGDHRAGVTRGHQPANHCRRNPGTPGESLNTANTVSNGTGGHGAIDFPDGSYMRLSPGTSVQISSVQLQKNGNVHAIAVAQKVGRTFTNVQHLANGASFSVSGHSVTAAVRGTQFEILVRPDHTNRIWVFVGQVKVTGKTSVTMTAGQEVDVGADGKLSSPHASTFDPTDPFPMAQQCSDAVSRGNNQGSSSASYGDAINSGQSAESDYYSPGGKLTVSLCYPRKHNGGDRHRSERRDLCEAGCAAGDAHRPQWTAWPVQGGCHGGERAGIWGGVLGRFCNRRAVLRRQRRHPAPSAARP
jgi:FecR-like protein